MGETTSKPTITLSSMNSEEKWIKATNITIVADGNVETVKKLDYLFYFQNPHSYIKASLSDCM